MKRFPEEEQAVLGKATAVDPSDRFESCAQFAHALDEIVENERRAADELVRKERQQIVDRRRRRRTRIIAGLALLAVMAAGWFVRQAVLRPRLTMLEDLEVTAGDETKLDVLAEGDWGGAPLDVTFENLPDGIAFDSQPVEGGADVRVTADLQNSSSNPEIILIARAGGNEVQKTILLTVHPADYQLPDHCEAAAGATLIKVDGKILYDSIDRVIRAPDGTEIRVKLLLIQKTEHSDVGTFYCMENKVSNELFAIFAGGKTAQIDADSKWAQGAWDGTKWLAADENPKNPVFNVSVNDAHDFSDWFGGSLPSVEQWDKAAGRWDHDETAEGPYRGLWDETADDGKIAVNRFGKGPLKVGTAKSDIGPFRCRDMAGNGREWTCTPDEVGKIFPIDLPTEIDFVITRGHNYTDGGPLQYDELTDELATQSEPYIFSESTAEVSFRCVIPAP